MEEEVKNVMAAIRGNAEEVAHRYTSILAERNELKIQVSALQQALETQNRENQPYIKELNMQVNAYKRAIEQILLQMCYGTSASNIPPSLFTNIALIMFENKIAIVSNALTRGIGIYIIPQNATGCDKPENE